MSALRVTDEILRAWLEDGPTDLPEPTRRAIEVSTRTTPQRRHAMRLPWRFTTMSTTFKLALGAAAVIAVILGGALVLGPRAPDNGVGGGPTLSPSPTASPSSSPSAAATPFDSAAWPTYTSRRYGFPIGHPADWTVEPATRAWTWDDASTYVNPGQENFHSADGRVRVSAWSVPFDPGTPVETWADVEAWAMDYCQKAGEGPCAGIHDRVVPLCLEKYDCHPALLVPFENDVQAFFQDGFTNSDKMIVVAVWSGDSEPAVAPYGGSRRLLEAFLSTMDIVPPDKSPYAPNGDAAATFLTTGH